MFPYINIFGLIGSILIGLSLSPQTYQVLKKEEIKNKSIILISINMLATAFMIIYGYHNGYVPVIIANSSVLLNNLIIFYYCIKEYNNT
jgi:uncharacterized protein with PQ loop repeat